MSDLKLTRGSIYWTRYGEKLRRLAVVLRAGPGPWIQARMFSTRNESWYAPSLYPRAIFAAQAEPGDYATRRALSFADLDLTKALLTPAPKKKPGPRPKVKK